MDLINRFRVELTAGTNGDKINSRFGEDYDYAKGLHTLVLEPSPYLWRMRMGEIRLDRRHGKATVSYLVSRGKRKQVVARIEVDPKDPAKMAQDIGSKLQELRDAGTR